MEKPLLAVGVFLAVFAANLPAAQASPWDSIGGSITDTPDAPDTNGYDGGYAFGNRDGAILAARLKQRTVEQSGCAAIDQLQSSLLGVIGSITPPQSDSQFVAGFYSGYVDAIRSTVEQARADCGVAGFSDGAFAGQLYGDVACQAAAISADATAALQLQPLYDGWSGGSAAVQAGCQAALLATLQGCAGDSAAPIAASLQLSCSDSP
jgi:hypothetical protein